MILWPLTAPRPEVSAFCEKVLAELAGISQIGQQKVCLSASIGAAISASGDVTPEMLLASADGAMYQAKSAAKALTPSVSYEPMLRHLSKNEDERLAAIDALAGLGAAMTTRSIRC